MFPFSRPLFTISSSFLSQLPIYIESLLHQARNSRLWEGRYKTEICHDNIETWDVSPATTLAHQLNTAWTKFRWRCRSMSGKPRSAIYGVEAWKIIEAREHRLHEQRAYYLCAFSLKTSLLSDWWCFLIWWTSDCMRRWHPGKGPAPGIPLCPDPSLWCLWRTLLLYIFLSGLHSLNCFGTHF